MGDFDAQVPAGERGGGSSRSRASGRHASTVPRTALAVLAVRKFASEVAIAGAGSTRPRQGADGVKIELAHRDRPRIPVAVNSAPISRSESGE
jgi:hypothetical protein